MANSDDEIDDEVITCWCGARGTYDELFDDGPDGDWYDDEGSGEHYRRLRLEDEGE